MLSRNVRIEEVQWGNRVLYAKKATKIKTAVRLFCGECMGMDRYSPKIEYPQEDVKLCTDGMCPLFEWRLGINPYPSKKAVEKGKKLGQRTQQIYRRKLLESIETPKARG